MTDVCPEHIKTHNHVNLTRLPDNAAVRPEFETFLDADSRARIPTRWTLAVSMGRKVCVCPCGQRGHWAAECPKRCKAGHGGKGDDGKGQGKKGKLDRGKTDEGKGKGKGGKWQARKVFKGYCNHCWKPRARVAKANVQAVLMNQRRAV